jgi:hypothetical protein
MVSKTRITEQENSRDFQHGAHAFVAKLLKGVNNYRPVRELRRGESYPPLGQFLSGENALSRPTFSITAAPKGDDKIVLMVTVDVESSNAIYHGSPALKSKAIAMAETIVGDMERLGGTVSETNFDRSSVNFTVVFSYTQPKQTTSTSSGQFYDPYLQFKNTPGERARTARMGRVGAEFRGSYGGDASNYRESVDVNESAGFVLFGQYIGNLIGNGSLSVVAGVLLYVGSVAMPLGALLGFAHWNDIKIAARRAIKDFKDRKNLTPERIAEINEASTQIMNSLSPGKRRFLISLLNKLNKAGLEDKQAVLSMAREVENYVQKNKKVESMNEAKVGSTHTFQPGDVVHILYKDIAGKTNHGTSNVDSATSGYVYVRHPEHDGMIKFHQGVNGKGGNEVGTTPGSIRGGFVISKSGSVKEDAIAATSTVSEGITDTIKRGVKSVKRGLQGWDKNAVGPNGQALGNPKEIVRRNKSYDDETLLKLAKDDRPSPHAPRSLQKRVVDREIRKRGLDRQGVAEGFGDYVGRKLQVKTTKGKPNPKNAPKWATALGQTPQGAWHWLEKEGPVETPDSDRYFPLSGKTEFTGFVGEYGDNQGVSKEIDSGQFEANQVYQVVAIDKSNALSKPVKLKVKAKSTDEVFSKLAANDWYALSIDGVDVINGKRLKQQMNEGMFGLSISERRRIQDYVEKISDIPGNWDFRNDTLSAEGIKALQSALGNNKKRLKYALSLTSKDYEAVDEAQTEKNPHKSALGKALYRDLSKEKKASPSQVERNKQRWAQIQAKRAGVYEASSKDTAIPQYTMKQFLERVKQGVIEPMHDPVPGKHLEVRSNVTGRRKTIYIKPLTESTHSLIDFIVNEGGKVK